jgi:hypothetical protein
MITYSGLCSVTSMANINMLSVKIFRQELYGYECKHNFKPCENYDKME